MPVDIRGRPYTLTPQEEALKRQSEEAMHGEFMATGPGAQMGNYGKRFAGELGLNWIPTEGGLPYFRTDAGRVAAYNGYMYPTTTPEAGMEAGRGEIQRAVLGARRDDRGGQVVFPEEVLSEEDQARGTVHVFGDAAGIESNTWSHEIRHEAIDREGPLPGADEELSNRMFDFFWNPNETAARGLFDYGLGDKATSSHQAELMEIGGFVDAIVQRETRATIERWDLDPEDAEDIADFTRKQYEARLKRSQKRLGNK